MTAASNPPRRAVLGAAAALCAMPPLQATAVDLQKLVLDMTELVASTMGPRIEVVVKDAAGAPPAKADRNQLELALLNLVVNARDAMPDGGVLTITADAPRPAEPLPPDLEPGAYLRLSVQDTGAGMDEATLARAVEPFFSTKGLGKGTGLGLSMVHGLAAQLGGALRISSRPGVGTRIELWLPRAAPGDVPVEPYEGRRQAAVTAESGLVLLVDDEELVRSSTAQMLGEMGYAVVEAESAGEALDLLDGGLDVQLVITDHLMPGMTGVELIEVLRRRKVRAPVLLASGYADVEGLAADLPRLNKPFRQAELAAKLDEMLEDGASL